MRPKNDSLFKIDDANSKRVCGIDEAGRGPIAGELVVVGVVLKRDIEGLNDSKKISPKKREKIFQEIIKNSFYHIYEADPKKIDKKGISFCIKEALEEIKSNFEDVEFIFDGNSSFGVDGITTLIKADSKIKAVSAASIIAKVYRDRKMVEADKIYPQYGFKNHKGYGTKKHIEAIKEFGYCEIHRKSFKIKELEAQERPLF